MPAILYERNAYDTSGPRLVGLQAANRQFLDALVSDERLDELGCYTAEEKDFDTFCTMIKPTKPSKKTIARILYGDHAGLSRAGVLHRYDPIITSYLWQRRSVDQRLYSVTGMIHSISSRPIMEAIGGLVVAPLQPWDALICTSRSGHKAVTTILSNWADYLAQRFNARPNLSIKLPIIPLGLDCDAFDAGSDTADIRGKTRAQLGIRDQDIAVLFVGRLSFKRKCHPVPMYLALQQAQKATGARVHFIQAGQFEDEREEEAFRAAAAQFCPDVRSLVVGGKQLFRDQGVWFAGDIFLSLSDNIQETFGLAPVEAMAVGLPVVVADWDGYRDTVREGIDGFRIPTTMPSPTAGRDVAERYHQFGNYRHYYGTVAMSTAVDVDACADVLARLIRDPALRHRMGQSGRERARTTYDWRTVLNAYHQLWGVLGEARRSADTVAPLLHGGPPYPLCDDPFRVFERYASRTIAPDTALSLGRLADLEQLRGSWMTHFGAEWRADRETASAILHRIAQHRTMTVAEIADGLDTPDARLQRTIVYMLKFGLLRTSNGPEASREL